MHEAGMTLNQGKCSSTMAPRRFSMFVHQRYRLQRDAKHLKKKESITALLRLATEYLIQQKTLYPFTVPGGATLCSQIPITRELFGRLTPTKDYNAGQPGKPMITLHTLLCYTYKTRYWGHKTLQYQWRLVSCLHTASNLGKIAFSFPVGVIFNHFQLGCKG